MSLKSIGHFQDAIYELLRKDPELKKDTAGVYLSVQQDAKYPFILLNLSYVQDLSKFTKALYEIEFEICLFSRDKSQRHLLTIADYISLLIKPNLLDVSDHHVTSVKQYRIEWVRGQDILTTKLVVKYKALVVQVS